MHCSTFRSDFGLFVWLYHLAVERSYRQITVGHLETCSLLNIAWSAWLFAVVGREIKTVISEGFLISLDYWSYLIQDICWAVESKVPLLVLAFTLPSFGYYTKDGGWMLHGSIRKGIGSSKYPPALLPSEHVSKSLCKSTVNLWYGLMMSKNNWLPHPEFTKLYEQDTCDCRKSG